MIGPPRKVNAREEPAGFLPPPPLPNPRARVGLDHLSACGGWQVKRPRTRVLTGLTGHLELLRRLDCGSLRENWDEAA